MKQHPPYWELTTGIQVIDPDGWRSAGISWETPITEAQFRDLCQSSTIRNLARNTKVAVKAPKTVSVSVELAHHINQLNEMLKAEFGDDYSYQIMGRGVTVGANCFGARAEAVIKPAIKS